MVMLFGFLGMRLIFFFGGRELEPLGFVPAVVRDVVVETENVVALTFGNADVIAVGRGEIHEMIIFCRDRPVEDDDFVELFRHCMAPIFELN